jgi:ribose transport system permease protein
MIRILGVLGLLVGLYAALISSNPNASNPSNLISVANLQGRYGIITLGAALVIITGGIDLSIGSVVGCSAILFGILMVDGMHPYLAAPVVLLFGAVVGLVNGLLITQLKLQPFLVTLCGMFVFRGVAQLLGGTVGHGTLLSDRPEFKESLHAMRYILIGKAPEIPDLGEPPGTLLYPTQFVVMLILAAVLGFFLHRTAYGRYWYAIGHNELAAKYAGVNVSRYRAVAYIVCSVLASLCGLMFYLDSGSLASNNAAETWELYAILGAVLGGCSLRGGEGTIVGVVLGAMVLPVLINLVRMRNVEDDVIPLVIGMTLLIGVIVDELIRRRSRVHR